MGHSMRSCCASQTKAKPTDVPDAVVEHFAGPARMMSAAEVEDAMRRFKKAVIERALGGELTHHLGYPAGGRSRTRRPITAMARREDGADR